MQEAFRMVFWHIFSLVDYFDKLHWKLCCLSSNAKNLHFQKSSGQANLVYKFKNPPKCITLALVSLQNQAWQHLKGINFHIWIRWVYTLHCTLYIVLTTCSDRTLLSFSSLFGPFSSKSLKLSLKLTVMMMLFQKIFEYFYQNQFCNTAKGNYDLVPSFYPPLSIMIWLLLSVDDQLWKSSTTTTGIWQVLTAHFIRLADLLQKFSQLFQQILHRRHFFQKQNFKICIWFRKDFPFCQFFVMFIKGGHSRL